MERHFLTSSVVPGNVGMNPTLSPGYPVSMTMGQQPPPYSAVLEPEYPQKHRRGHSHSTRSGKKIKDVKLKDRLGRAIEIDSDDEDNWDRGAAQKRVWGERAGPNRERPVDDLMITFRDLFPCLGPLLDSCGCARRKPRRQLLRQNEPPRADGPRVEQVCLECGNVLESRVFPGTVAIDMFDRGTQQRHDAYLDVTGQNSPHGPRFEGYETWTTSAPQPGARSGFIALPQFELAPGRVLKNAPGTTTLPVEDEFASDPTGHIELPDFPLPKTAA